jgi:predicted amidohydrolase
VRYLFIRYSFLLSSSFLTARGKVLSNAYEGTPIVTYVDIDLDYVAKVRAQIPKEKHLKWNVYASGMRGIV